MILQALQQFAEDEGLVDDLDFEWKPVGYLVRVHDGGRFLGIESTYIIPEADEGTKRKPRPVAKSFRVPREPGRTSGDRANFLVDKSEYAFGLDPEQDDTKKRPAEKLARRFELFRERVRACLEATGDEGVAAVDALLENVAQGRQTVHLPKECAGNDLFGFAYGTEAHLVTNRAKVRAYWKSQRSLHGTEPHGSHICLVTGQVAAPVKNHTQLKYVPGSVTSGVPLVSFNNKAFESYGWSGNHNATVSRRSAESYATALQRLLHPAPPDPKVPGTTLPRQNHRLSDNTTVCYWTRGRGDFASLLGEILEVEKVPELYQSIWKGQVPGLLGDASAEDAFYALALTGAQGRVIVRGWFESTVRDVSRNLARYFADIDIVRNTPKPKKGDLPPQYPLAQLLLALAVRGESKNIHGPMAAQLFQAALQGTRFPLSALQRAILRTRAEIGKTGWKDLLRRDARAALIKGVLNRNYARDSNSNFKEVTPDMDPTNDNPGYVLGRLMAVIERLQQTALNDVNASVVDRFFSAASAAPRSVFVRLLKNARHHARKAKDDTRTKNTALWLERQIDELSNRFDPKQNGFPPHLSLQEQGLFVLGYHQQRHWMFQSKEARNASTESEV